VVRDRRKYYATNRLSLTAQEVRAHYKRRHEVEDVIRTLKSQLSLEACQGGSRRPGAPTARPQPCAQEHHVALCLVDYLIVERERLDQGYTWRQLKRQLILNGVQASLPALERVRMAAQLLFQEKNPWALRNIIERLMEAVQRGLWDQPDEAQLAQMRQVYLRLEGELEDRMDTTQHSGG
jgi:CobN/Magnesium Chelatase/Transposase DDE domain